MCKDMHERDEEWLQFFWQTTDVFVQIYFQTTKLLQ